MPVVSWVAVGGWEMVRVSVGVVVVVWKKTRVSVVEGPNGAIHKELVEKSIKVCSAHVQVAGKESKPVMAPVLASTRSIIFALFGGNQTYFPS